MSKKIKFLSIGIISIATGLVIGFFILINQQPPEMSEIQCVNLYDEDGVLFMSITNDEKRSWVGLSEVSDNFIQSVIAIEDKKYYTHSGIDVVRIFGSLFANIRSGEIVQGASTITQQYARNEFLTLEQTYSRKVKEIILALQLENYYDKDEILEGYVNTVYFGHGIYGVEDASKFYFNKSAENLTVAESAVLTAVLKGPSYYSPIIDYEKNKTRKELVLNELFEDNIIDEETYNDAINEEIEIFGVRNSSIYSNNSYYADYVLTELEQLDVDLESNISIDLYTTLNQDFQSKIESSAKEEIESDIQVSVVGIEPNTGYIKGLIGGKNYQESQYNRAYMSYRQPGSTIKPLLYYTALENGLSTTTTFLSSKTSFYLSENEIYEPTNYASTYANKEIAMPYALATSDNIYAVKTHLFLGTDKLASVINSFGFKNKASALPSLALGAIDLNLIELTSLYSTFASLGNYTTPTSIRYISDYNGNVVYENEDSLEAILDEDSVFIMNELMNGMFDTNMNDVINVTGTSISYKLTHTYAGKSGTTDTDNWMVGFNQNIVVGVWSGYDDYREVTTYEDHIISKNIWVDTIEYYNDGFDDTWYTPTDGVLGKYCSPITGTCNSSDYKKILYYKV